MDTYFSTGAAVRRRWALGIMGGGLQIGGGRTLLENQLPGMRSDRHFQKALSRGGTFGAWRTKFVWGFYIRVFS
jgi:hypothetical protein